MTLIVSFFRNKDNYYGAKGEDNDEGWRRFSGYSYLIFGPCLYHWKLLCQSILARNNCPTKNPITQFTRDEDANTSVLGANSLHSLLKTRQGIVRNVELSMAPKSIEKANDGDQTNTKVRNLYSWELPTHWIICPIGRCRSNRPCFFVNIISLLLISLAYSKRGQMEKQASFPALPCLSASASNL